jgi:fumarate reductase subunit D
MRSDWRGRNHPAFWAFVVHRVSGLALAVFLPGHFWALSQALQGAAQMDTFLALTQQPLVKVAEFAVVLALAAHLTGGLRLLVLEFLPWRGWQKSLAAVAAGVSLAVAIGFALALAG